MTIKNYDENPFTATTLSVVVVVVVEVILFFCLQRRVEVTERKESTTSMIKPD